MKYTAPFKEEVKMNKKPKLEVNKKMKMKTILFSAIIAAALTSYSFGLINFASATNPMTGSDSSSYCGASISVYIEGRYWPPDANYFDTAKWVIDRSHIYAWCYPTGDMWFHIWTDTQQDGPPEGVWFPINHYEIESDAYDAQYLYGDAGTVICYETQPVWQYVWREANCVVGPA